MMYWYNPITKEEEEAYPPAFDAQAIGMLSGHRHSDRFIEEYRQLRMRPQTDVAEALFFTGERFYSKHRRCQPPG